MSETVYETTFDRTWQVWTFILSYATNPANEGATPTYREIAKALKLSSNSVVAYHMRRLKEMDHIRFKVAGGRYTIAGATLSVPVTEFNTPKRKRRKRWNPYGEERI